MTHSTCYFNILNLFTGRNENKNDDLSNRSLKTARIRFQPQQDDRSLYSQQMSLASYQKSARWFALLNSQKAALRCCFSGSTWSLSQWDLLSETKLMCVFFSRAISPVLISYAVPLCSITLYIWLLDAVTPMPLVVVHDTQEVSEMICGPCAWCCLCPPIMGARGLLRRLSPRNWVQVWAWEFRTESKTVFCFNIKPSSTRIPTSVPLCTSRTVLTTVKHGLPPRICLDFWQRATMVLAARSAVQLVPVCKQRVDA